MARWCRLDRGRRVPAGREHAGAAAVARDGEPARIRRTLGDADVADIQMARTATYRLDYQYPTGARHAASARRRRRREQAIGIVRDA